MAKGWLLAMVEDAPLEEAAAILAGDVARDGPRICDAVVRAIYDEADLRRIERGGVLEPLVSRAGEIAGARGAAAAAHAVETLRSIIWSGLRAELFVTDPDLVADAGERLSLVAELVRAAVLRRLSTGESDAPRRPRVAPLRVARSDLPSLSREGTGGVAPPERRGEGGGAPGLEGTGGSAGMPGTTGSFEDRESAHDTESGFTRRGAGSRETRGRAVGDALWIGALRDEIVRAAQARSPLSLLLVELEEAERMLASEPRSGSTATFGRFAQAVRTAVRNRDVLACETESRAWIIARDTGRAGAQALGMRIVAALPAEETWRGAPLTVSVGLAVLGEDGHNAAALIDAAEQTRFAAEASGIGIVSGGPDDGDSDQPGPSLVS